MQVSSLFDDEKAHTHTHTHTHSGPQGEKYTNDAVGYTSKRSRAQWEGLTPRKPSLASQNPSAWAMLTMLTVRADEIPKRFALTASARGADQKTYARCDPLRI